MTTTLTVHHPDAARLLVDSEQVQYLLPFMPCARSLTEAARRLGVSVPHLRYHVRRFLELGLLQVSETRPRRGPAVVCYQSTARRFFVPFSATPYENFEAMVLRKDLAWQAVLSREWTDARLGPLRFEQGGVRFSSDPEGRLVTEYVTGPEAPRPSKTRNLHDRSAAKWNSWSTLRLSETEALALEQELHDVWHKYLQCSGEGQYLLRLGLAPFVFDHSAPEERD
ncbi:helix-turn-helix transcriptional regulator [Deinococcus roseus]|uniref:ArsR family transcriptional regulator n=1 Tax=Deinococcus roseus TaxID=392414 RepID=A0ABQ2D2W9_9DEIO|nr:helix-turn-helix transcriptional regulator [Deinococcus roseus]GGJ42980.1 hypothetical protein GCM10008938_31460 [Deinococcus roseus]